MKKTKLLITATIVATVLTATACGGKNQASTATEAQTTTVAVKQNLTSTEKATDKQEVTEASVENTEASNEEVLVAEAVTDENQGNSDSVESDSVEEVNNTVLEEQPAENTNAGWTDPTPAEQPVEEAPAEDTNCAVEETPVEQPVAPEPTPEPVVTPQEPAAPTLTDEERLVATGKWTKIDEWNEYTYYEYVDSITGYSMEACFYNGTFHHEQWNSLEEEEAIYLAHGITDNVVSFDRLMKISNS